jgi:hypothetical protein
MMLLNGKRYHEEPTETPEVDTVELWEIINLTGVTHPVHIHLTQFRVLQRRPFAGTTFTPGVPLNYTGPARLPDPNEQGWKDTVRVYPYEVVTLWVPFTVCLHAYMPTSCASCACACVVCFVCVVLWLMVVSGLAGVHGEVRVALSYAGARGSGHDAASRRPAQEAVRLRCALGHARADARTRTPLEERALDETKRSHDEGKRRVRECTCFIQLHQISERCPNTIKMMNIVKCQVSSGATQKGMRLPRRGVCFKRSPGNFDLWTKQESRATLAKRIQQNQECTTVACISASTTKMKNKMRRYVLPFFLSHRLWN